MAMPRAPIDPYCGKNGPARRMTTNDSDPRIASLAAYAKRAGYRAWRYEDGKIALVNKDNVPTLLGGEGDSFETTMAKAHSTLVDEGQQLEEKARLTRAVAKASREGRVAPVEPIVPLKEGGVINQKVWAYTDGLPSSAEQARLITGQRSFPLLQRLLQPDINPLVVVESQLKSMGESGAELAVLFRRRNELVASIRGRAITRLNDVLKDLTPKEIAVDYQQWVEKGIADPKRVPALQKAYTLINEIDNEFYETARALGIPVKPKVGKGNTNPTGRYFTHRFDFNTLQNKRLTRDMIEQVKAEIGAEMKRKNPALTPDQLVVSDDEAVNVLEKLGLGTVGEALERKLMDMGAERGAPITRLDAKELIDRQFKKHAERISGNLERDRLGVEGYVTDVRKAYGATWTRNAYRVSDWAVFGPKDGRVHQLLDDVQRKYGSRALDMARKVYHLEIGQDRVHLNPVLKEIYNWQAAKLSYAVMPNMLQGANPMISAGFRPFLEAAASTAKATNFFTKGGFRKGAAPVGSAARIAEEAGYIPVQMWEGNGVMSMIHDTQDAMNSRGLAALMPEEPFVDSAAAKRLGKWLTTASRKVSTWSLGAFRMVEEANRAMAGEAGERYFSQIADTLSRQGERALTNKAFVRRLGEMDMDPRKVLEAVKARDHIALGQYKQIAGLRMSNKTQFQSDYQSMPLWANESALGKFMFQFKNFSFNQTRWMLGEVLGGMAEAKTGSPARLARFMGLMTTVFPATGIMLTSLRSSLMGPTLASEAIDRDLDDPTIGSIMHAGILGITMMGGLGVIADIAATVALGNQFSMRSFFLPPAASSAINAMSISGAALRASVNHDPKEFDHAVNAFSREFGGAGSTIYRVGREKLTDLPTQGREPTGPVETGKALARALRQLSR